MIKSCLALYNKILPPTAGVKEVNPKLKIEDSPFYIVTEREKNGKEQTGTQDGQMSVHMDLEVLIFIFVWRNSDLNL